MDNYRGSCLCGKVTFSVTGFKGSIGNCHCTMCRKFHGSAFATLANVSNFRWLTGEAYLKDYIAPNGTIRTFCSNCGSSLGFRSQNANIKDIEVALATFDEALPISVEVQVYCAYKANWYELDLSIKSFAEGEAQ